MENELKDVKMTLGEAEKKAKNRTEWRDLVVTLCFARRIGRKVTNVKTFKGLI